MKNIEKILLASHGTPGAKAAEQFIYQLGDSHCSVYHLVVVPDFWKGMTGDDWLNNASTQKTYGDYIESQLEKEIIEHTDKLVKEFTSNNYTYQYRVMTGKPHECLISAAQELKPDVIVIGSPRPKGVEGYRSRMALDPIVKTLNTPLCIIPFPNE
ncbi:MAG: hypothetical protein BMS9Abin36_0586 [Gammaproteobacteria bacterium]|nr:MAG: hypothetical protein BMS9Abin36_0586 [Gammaproteobacteria bacterium]